MDKELFTKLYNDGCFKTFCNQIGQLRGQGYKIRLPLETTTLLLGSGIGYTKGDKAIASIHNLVKEFLNPSGREVSKGTAFYDYFVITTIMQIADGKKEQLGGNRWRQLPLDLTRYADSICKFDTCTCGHKPEVLFSNFFNCLTGKAVCEKCGLSVTKMFIYDELKPDQPVREAYVNLEDGIKKLSELWNEEVAKGENILYRTMRKLLSYGSNVCVDPAIYDLHIKLYGYMVENGIYRKPEYWNEPGYWDIATGKMMDCREPVQWVEEYLWENMPCKIGA